MSIIHTKTTTSLVDPRRARLGFSLVELLSVMAVIAILAAIIFPVYSQAREAGKRTTAISNMHSISQGLARYVLDHDGKYPQVLFAYADGVHSMHSIATAYSGNSPQYSQYMQGIYPTYVSNAGAFTDPDDEVSDINSATAIGPLNVNTLQVVTPLSGVPTRNVLARDPVARSYFQGDAFDVSPVIIGPNKIADGVGQDPPLTLVPRYQPAWTSVMDPTVLQYTPTTFTTTPVGQDGITYDEYLRQLDNPASTDDTYVTCTTYHVGHQNYVVVLFKGGTAKSMDATRFIAAAHGTDSSDITADNKGVAKCRIWTITPTGAH